MSNAVLVHCINNALKANYAMAKDFDYVVVEDEIVIVDQNTGRLMEGRHKLEARKDTSYLAMPYLYDAVRATKHTINLKNLIPAALMMIKSAEEGATIYIDDKDNGTTKSASLIAVGKHSIVLKKKGFENTDTTVMLEHGKVANITLAMQPLVNKWLSTANIAYSLAPQMSYGLTVGSVKYWGWYLTAMTNFSFDFANHELASIGEGYYTGEEKTTRFAVTAGVIRRLNKMFYIKAGVGYGIRSLSWQKSDGNWVNIDGNSAVRRTCNLTLVAKDVNITDFYWGVSNKFTLEIGVKNFINPIYPDIIWFK